ncbi:MAG TPA: c-type cytochrome [Candidatus Eisenbacteria bacterium]|nr:c-type cytochrome [Candidatus Eisenbacteria bacterium]
MTNEHPHGPAPHGHDDDPHGESLSNVLAIAQFLVTAVVLVVVAGLAYVAGRHSGGGHGEGNAPAPAAAAANVSALLDPTPELIAEGKALYGVNCASCHGNTGTGDGPAAAALNPKPRNFTSGEWRYGGGLARVVRTISEGSPGTAMAAFANLPMGDRVKLAHYVRSLGPSLAEDNPDDRAWLVPPGSGEGATASGGTAGTPAPAPAAPSGPVISIEDAIAALAVPETAPGTVAVPVDAVPVHSVYSERCASCHGMPGEGGSRVRMLGSAPYAYVTTRSLGASPAPWASDPGAFERLVVRGIPGYAMPGNGDLSRGEISELYQHVLKLRALQSTRTSSPRPAGS